MDLLHSGPKQSTNIMVPAYRNGSTFSIIEKSGRREVWKNKEQGVWRRVGEDEGDRREDNGARRRRLGVKDWR